VDHRGYAFPLEQASESEYSLRFDGHTQFVFDVALIDGYQLFLGMWSLAIWRQNCFHQDKGKLSERWVTFEGYKIR